MIFPGSANHSPGVSPYDGHTDFVIGNGKITDVVATWGPGTTFGRGARQPFIAWSA